MLCHRTLLARGGKRVAFGQKVIWNVARCDVQTIPRSVACNFKPLLRSAREASERLIDFTIRASGGAHVVGAFNSPSVQRQLGIFTTLLWPSKKATARVA